MRIAVTAKIADPEIVRKDEQDVWLPGVLRR
jgi:hypothetical protein